MPIPEGYHSTQLAHNSIHRVPFVRFTVFSFLSFGIHLLFMPLTKCSILRIIDACDTLIAAVAANIFDVQSQHTFFIVTV